MGKAMVRPDESFKEMKAPLKQPWGSYCLGGVFVFVGLDWLSQWISHRYFTDRFENTYTGPSAMVMMGILFTIGLAFFGIGIRRSIQIRKIRAAPKEILMRSGE
jgi:hypothetical protein